jgi:Ca2+-dependent lipid-binding protein
MIKRITKTIAVIGIKIANAAKPKAGKSAIKICSDPYADDEIQSDERIPNAYRLLRR